MRIAEIHELIGPPSIFDIKIRLGFTMEVIQMINIRHYNDSPLERWERIKPHFTRVHLFNVLNKSNMSHLNNTYKVYDEVKAHFNKVQKEYEIRYAKR